MRLLSLENCLDPSWPSCRQISPAAKFSRKLPPTCFVASRVQSGSGGETSRSAWCETANLVGDMLFVTIIPNFAFFSYFTTDRFNNQVYPHLVRVHENGLRNNCNSGRTVVKRANSIKRERERSYPFVRFQALALSTGTAGSGSDR